MKLRLLKADFFTSQIPEFLRRSAAFLPRIFLQSCRHNLPEKKKIFFIQAFDTISQEQGLLFSPIINQSSPPREIEKRLREKA